MMALEQITFNIGAFNDANAGGNNYYAGEVFYVKLQSNNAIAEIYSDSSGASQIPQNGIDNVSNSSGECDFWISEGLYYIEVNGDKKNFKSGVTAESVLTDNNSNVEAFVKSRYLSTAELSTGLYSNDNLAIVSDRGTSQFTIKAGTANGLDKVNAGSGLIAELEKPNQNPIAWGAKADNSTDDSAKITSILPLSSIDGRDLIFNVESPVQLSNDINGGLFNYTGGVSQAFTFTTDNSGLYGASISSDKHGLQATSVTRGNDIIHTKITADSYGVLANDTANGSSKLRIAFCDIFSNTADAVELNNPSHGTSGNMVLGNFLHADANGTSSNSGFSVGTAGVNGHIVAFNYSSESRNEAYHTEDFQRMGVQMGNVFDGCLDDGTFISGQFEPEFALGEIADGLVSVGNRYKFAGTGAATKYGMYFAYPTSNGYLDMCTTIGNYTDGFGIGIHLSSKTLSYTAGNVLDDGDTAIQQLQGSLFVGDNISRGCETLFNGGGATIAGGIHSKEKPTNIVVNNGSANQIGSAIKRFSFKTPYTHGGASLYEDFDLFDSGAMIGGRLNLMLQNGTSNFTLTALISWDGTTFTATDQVRRNNGNIFGTITLIESGGRVKVTVGSASAITAGNLFVDFDGFYYVK